MVLVGCWVGLGVGYCLFNKGFKCRLFSFVFWGLVVYRIFLLSSCGGVGSGGYVLSIGVVCKIFLFYS